jgi:hypothetical protein
MKPPHFINVKSIVAHGSCEDVGEGEHGWGEGGSDFGCVLRCGDGDHPCAVASASKTGRDDRPASTRLSTVVAGWWMVAIRNA